ncbi:MAG TPA: AAA family ATPase [Mycobacteriales bacterium]|nr:AAA family ATPase [Mycobacteriales bacterium]
MLATEGDRGAPMQRVLVIGQSGSGKSTVAAELAQRLHVPHVELDALFHGPGWVPNPAFPDEVDAATRGPGWVVDGNYPAVRDLLWTRADTVIWLDLPRTTTLRRTLWRTLRRALTRAELWNGNREQLRAVLRASHPIRWAWATHAAHRGEYEQRLADPRSSHLVVRRLRTPAEVGAWSAQLGA